MPGGKAPFWHNCFSPRKKPRNRKKGYIHPIMSGLKSFLASLYITPLFLLVIGVFVIWSTLGFFYPVAYDLIWPFILGFLIFLGIDGYLLFRKNKGIRARRDHFTRLSNGDENPVRIHLRNAYSFPVNLKVIDELPYQFQERDSRFFLRMGPGGSRVLKYHLRPKERGAYVFGALNVFVKSPIGLIRRRYKLPQEETVPVYPAFLKMRKFELLAATNRLWEVGVKRLRRIGQSMEFDQIREYVIGDDQRSINWKATARRGKLMVNQYQDERSQQVYSLIDMGRAMKMPFQGMTLLDHAINATLVLSNIAIYKKDRAGLVTFSHKVHSQLPASRRSVQLERMLEVLYRQRTDFLETDHQRLYSHMKRKVRQRGLVLLFTNFETLSGLRRQLGFLRKLARDHLLLVIFFRNTELDEFINQKAEHTEAIYQQTLARQFVHEKKQIVKELGQYGIHSLLTAPEDLTVNTINKYLEFKARGYI